MFLRHLVKIERKKNYNFEVRIEKKIKGHCDLAQLYLFLFYPNFDYFPGDVFSLKFDILLFILWFVCVVLIVVRFIVCFFKYNKFCKKEREQ